MASNVVDGDGLAALFDRCGASSARRCRPSGRSWERCRRPRPSSPPVRRRASQAHDLHAAAGAHAARHRDRRQHDALVGDGRPVRARSGGTVSAKKTVNQCGGSSWPRLIAVADRRRRSRRRGGRPSCRYRPRPCAPARSRAAESFIASSIQLMSVSPKVCGAHPPTKKGPQQRGLSTSGKACPERSGNSSAFERPAFSASGQLRQIE